MSQITKKETKRAYNKKYYAANRKKLNAYQRAYRRRHPEKAKKWSSYKSNPKRRGKQIRAWVTANPEKRLATQRKSRGMPVPTRSTPGCCECCGRPPGKKSLALDHCHETHLFRGWLCDRCNLGIGLLGDSANGVQRALNYLLRDKPTRNSEPDK